MRIYCFETPGNLEWPTGTAVVARDLRTSTSVLLYRTLDDAAHPQASNAPPPGGAIAERLRARAVFASLPPASSLQPMELFTCKGFTVLAAPDEATAASALRRFRAEGLFREATPPPPSPPPAPPPPSLRCNLCGKERPLTNGRCVDCTPKRPRRLLPWFVFFCVTLFAGILYLAWPPPAVRTINRSPAHSSPPRYVERPPPVPVSDPQLTPASPDPSTSPAVSNLAPPRSADDPPAAPKPRSPSPSSAAATAPVPIQPPTIVDFHAVAPEIDVGMSTVLHWQVSGPVTRTSITPSLASAPPSGEQEVHPDQTTQYTLSAEGPGGVIVQPLVVRVRALQPPVISFTADSLQLKLGQSTDLHWSVTGATRTTIDPAPGPSNPSGSFSVRPIGNTRYTLTAQGPGGTASHSVNLQVAGIAGPSSGQLVWTGNLSGEELITIDRNHADIGQLVGELPGLPCIIQPADEHKVIVASAPGPANNFDRLVLRVRGKGVTRVVVRWSLQ